MFETTNPYFMERILMTVINDITMNTLLTIPNIFRIIIGYGQPIS